MSLYRIHSKQTLPISKDLAWEFLSNPRNLQKITPKSMDFKIISGADRTIFPGQIIEYIVKPFPFYAVTWVTEITHVENGSYFVDEQRFGPYSFWHHKHFIVETSNGVEMEDIVDYKLPFGILGRLVHRLFVKKQLERIFEYRKAKLELIFGPTDTIAPNLVLQTV